MQFEKTKLEGVVLVKPAEAFEDFRGSYIETYHEEEFRKAGIDVKFVVDDHSRSSKGVLRGLHGDEKTWKLISCLHGKFYFVVADVRKESPQFGEWQAFTLSDRNHWAVLVPPRFANGHLALTDDIIFHYKQSEYFTPGRQFTYRYDDPKMNIWWPIKQPILSQRDEAGEYLG